MKTYTVTNQINKEQIINSIVKANKNCRKYNYSPKDVKGWVESLPEKGDTIQLENAQHTGFFSTLFSHWGTRTVGYTYCLWISKNPETSECTISLGTQQTIGRRHYGCISPKLAS